MKLNQNFLAWKAIIIRAQWAAVITFAAVIIALLRGLDEAQPAQIAIRIVLFYCAAFLALCLLQLCIYVVSKLSAARKK